jgi:hypothetical protein
MFLNIARDRIHIACTDNSRSLAPGTERIASRGHCQINIFFLRLDELPQKLAV